MVEFILVIAGFGGLAFNQATGVAITTIPAPFYTMAECQAAGQQAVSDLSPSKGGSFSCLKRTLPAAKLTPAG